MTRMAALKGRRAADLLDVENVVRLRYRRGLTTTARDVHDAIDVAPMTIAYRLRRLLALGRVQRVETVGSVRGRAPTAYVPVMP